MTTLVSSFADLDVSLTLRAGQVFGWELSLDSRWEGVIGETAFSLHQDNHTGVVTFSYSKGSLDNDAVARACLRDYFQLDIDLVSLIKSWGKCDSTFNRLIPETCKFAGLRICRQDPFECLISFIVSANNNIKRISQNLKSIRTKYGTRIDGDSYAFPTLPQLAVATAEEFRQLGLGYRAEYIVKTVRMLSDDSGLVTLYKLRQESDVNIARNFLMKLSGVGRKVADCVSLYSLDFPAVAPVDTHMYQIACRLFSRTIKKDNNMHDLIQEAMVDRFGEKAGWAHCFLFAADLRDLQDPPLTKRAKLRE